MFDIGVYPICYANRMANSSILKVSRFQDEALIEYENGCVADAANKERCPMFGVCKDAPTRICAEDVKMAIETVQKWSDEHPKKTYAQDFFEKFPKAQRNWDGTPFVCRKRIYGGIHSATLEDCDYTRACYRCWNEPMNDEETKGA